MNDITVQWVGDSRMIPGIGEGSPGSKLTGPSEVMNSFIEQGLAVPEEGTTRTKNSKTHSTDKEVEK